MAWMYLFVAAAFEVIWAVALKQSEGFTKPLPTAISWVGMVLSFVFLAQSVKTLPLGTAYAIWTGIGVAGTALYGIFYFHEPHTFWRTICILLIVAGVAGLKFYTPA